MTDRQKPDPTDSDHAKLYAEWAKRGFQKPDSEHAAKYYAEWAKLQTQQTQQTPGNPWYSRLNPKRDSDDGLAAAVAHIQGTSDVWYPPSPTPRQLQVVPGDDETVETYAARQRQVTETGLWLPEGFFYGLHIEHRPLESAGPFTGGGNKWVWHITVSDWFTVDAMYTVLRDKRAAPHLLIGGRPGTKHPVVIQMLPFTVAGRALAHPSGPETNRADCIQTEVCATPASVPSFSNTQYKAFANLVRLTNIVALQNREVPHELARSFKSTTRFDGAGFVATKGHCGHMHVPGNDHIDPTTAFRGQHLMTLLKKMPAGGYKL